MTTTGAASLEDDVAQLSIEDVLAAVCAPQASGAGVAAALSLALAAACARKAVSVTIKRGTAGTEATAALDALGERLQLQQHRAVAHARRDALLFKAWLQSREPRQAQHLVESAQHFQVLVTAVGEELEGLRERVAPVVAGDVDAGLALHRAAGEIAADLLREARGERNRSVA